MTKVILSKDTNVNGKLQSNSLDVNDRLIVNGDDIIVKVPIQGEIKEFTMSKIIEAIMALNERTCMMYPDYNFIKAAEAIPSHDTDNDLLPDLLTGLTIEITRDGEVIYSFFIAESSISTELTRGMMLKTEEVDIIMNVLKTKEKPEDLTFISPVIYEDADPGKITLKSFSLSEDSDILPETDGVYKYTVTDKDDALAISITGDSGVYNEDFEKAFVHTTEQIEGKSRAVLYPIPPLFDGIIYNGNEYKRLNDVFNEKAEGKPYSGIGAVLRMYICHMVDSLSRCT